MTAALKRAGALASLGGLLTGSKERRQVRLAQKLGALHGLPQKIGQMLALGELEQGDAVFAQLTRGSSALTPSKARAALTEVFGQPLQNLFKTISLEGIGASLGQVHRATLHDGTEVAVKLQYPGIADAVRVDLQALGLLGQVYRRGYDLRSYRETLGQMMERELDYSLEATALEHFGALTADDATFATPRLIARLSGARVLTMTWLEGYELADVVTMPLDARQSASRALIRWFLRSVLEWGLIHGDGHPGNIRFLKDNSGALRLGMLDFGCVQALDPSTAGGLRLLVECVAAGETGTAAHWLARYEAMGFSRELLEPIGSELGAVSKLLVSPLTLDGPFDPALWDINERFKLLLGENRFAFRFAAPSAFAFVTRAFIGLVQTLKALAAPVAWRPLFDEIARRSTKNQPVELVLPAKAVTKVEAAPVLSKSLRIHINSTSGTRIDLTFGARAAENLAGLVPPEITPRLVERHIDVQSIERRAVSSRFAPGELFHLEEPERQVRVWLE